MPDALNTILIMQAAALWVDIAYRLIRMYYERRKVRLLEEMRDMEKRLKEAGG